jgi:prepilin-type N-terminal cleavage/methylation domain-containing protein/prepilin-type processing-associated H-X9-DG protein
MLRKRKNGFTLVELLVVISILGILSAVLVSQFKRAHETAVAMKCKANLYNLAKAALNYGVDQEWMPCAGSYEQCGPVVDSNSKYVSMYSECRGWVAWTGTGRWVNRDLQSGQMKNACYFGNTAYDSITNGTLWSYVGKDLSAYTCDVHKRVAIKAGLKNVSRSYVMNGNFGFNNKANPTPEHMPDWHQIRLDALSTEGHAAGNLLLFAELPAFKGSAHEESVATDEFGSDADGVLETDINGYACEKTEKLGFNHQVGKRYVAHVAFADGHVEVLAEPQGSSDSDLIDMARQLCNGEEISQSLRNKMR